MRYCFYEYWEQLNTESEKNRMLAMIGDKWANPL